MTRSNGAEVAERRAGLESDGSEHDITLIQRSWALARQMGILGPFVVLFVVLAVSSAPFLPAPTCSISSTSSRRS